MVVGEGLTFAGPRDQPQLKDSTSYDHPSLRIAHKILDTVIPFDVVTQGGREEILLKQGSCFSLYVWLPDSSSLHILDPRFISTLHLSDNRSTNFIMGLVEVDYFKNPLTKITVQDLKSNCIKAHSKFRTELNLETSLTDLSRHLLFRHCTYFCHLFLHSTYIFPNLVRDETLLKQIILLFDSSAASESCTARNQAETKRLVLKFSCPIGIRGRFGLESRRRMQRDLCFFLGGVVHVQNHAGSGLSTPRSGRSRSGTRTGKLFSWKTAFPIVIPPITVTYFFLKLWFTFNVFLEF